MSYPPTKGLSFLLGGPSSQFAEDVGYGVGGVVGWTVGAGVGVEIVGITVVVGIFTGDLSEVFVGNELFGVDTNSFLFKRFDTRFSKAFGL